MSKSTHQAKCGKCKIALEVIANDDSQKIATCPKCGDSDTVEYVTRIIGEYAKERMALALHKTLVDTARGSKFLKVKSSSPPKRQHRFIVDLDI